ncbi:MAG: hypothetical protein WAT78_09025 [Rhizobiaceae bacterium]
MKIIKHAAEYCSFYIAGSIEGRIPIDVEGRQFAFDSRCINVGCIAGQFDDVEITILSPGETVPDAPPALDRFITTSEGAVIFFDALVDNIHALPVTGKKTLIRIWVNNNREADKVTVAVG